MSGAKLPIAVRLAPSTMCQEDGSQDVLGPSKFGITWPAEPPPPVQPPPSGERPATLSSSEGESDLSEVEASSPVGKVVSHTDQSDGSDDAHSHHWRAPQQLVADQVEEMPSIPRLSRAISLPLPSQLEHLQNPRRSPLSTVSPPTPIPENDSETVDLPKFQEFSLELADTVQMVVQTLLQISPAQILDPAKEQFSACSLSVPTSCMSAVFTSLKSLNYMSANMPALCEDLNSLASTTSGPTIPSCLSTDFDIGEMLQSVGDALSGAAAHAGVDLVLFHGDVGMRHVAVKGDECGISYVLSHVVRQVITSARRGDSIEIGLSIASPVSDNTPPVENAEDSSEGATTLPTVTPEDGLLRCTFEINHNFVIPETPVVDDSHYSALSGIAERIKPSFGSLLLRRLLGRVGATLDPNAEMKSSYPGQTFEVVVSLESGSPSTISAKTTPAVEDTSSILSGVRIGSEPSLEELSQFVETLRGKKATLYASVRSSFAHHLTSYLTAWGLDVSHVSSESAELESNVSQADSTTSSVSGESRATGGFPVRPRPYGGALEDVQEHPEEGTRPFLNGEGRSQGPISFDFIDDDVSVLRERLRKYRSEHASQAGSHPRKRPSLSANHRPRSSPHVARAMGLPISALFLSTPVVVVHFTSLSNYKIVKDIIQRDLAAHASPFLMPPEVMIIPKPAGPRRFLTALHTAVKKPVVDPFFAPIATSPISPGLHGVSPYFNMTQEPAPKSPSSRPVGASRTNSDRSVRSPKEMMVETYNLAPPSPLGMSDSIEYFPETGVKLGASPSSGLVIQSPDGQPAGIFFHPRAKNTRSVASGGIGMERDKGQFLLPSAERPRMAVARRASDTDEHSVSFSSLHTGTVPTGYRDQQPSEGQLPASPGLKTKGKKPLSPSKEEPSHTRAKPPVSPPPSRRASPMEMRKGSTPPGSPSHEPSTNPPPRRSRRVHPDSLKPNSPTSASNKAKGSADANIVPPISVLIVDDNPINQTILSTFMKKKKIKFDVAKNGEEAVQKWHSGGFHLILMDIQMPVMDGIEATKEIRRLENLSASSGYTPSTPQSDLNIRTPSEAPSTESRNSVSPYRSSVIIVALTASSLQSDRVAALAAGCNDFLTKPVSLQWLNNKIIEWGSIKALQMWADLRPEVVKTISTEQTAQAQNVARRLHVPEGRVTPANSPSRSSSLARKNTISETAAQAMYKLADDSPGETPTPPANMAAILDNSLPASSPGPLTPAENTASPVMETPEANADTPTPEAVIPHSDVAEANGDSKQAGQSPPADLSVSSDQTPPITSQ